MPIVLLMPPRALSIPTALLKAPIFSAPVQAEEPNFSALADLLKSPPIPPIA
jgi:hypothetical protein